MKKFLIKISAFIVPLLVMVYALDFFITKNLKKSRSFAEGEIAVWEDIYSGNAQSDMLIYGSSRAFVHVDPILIQDSLHISCYNFGANGQDFRIQYLRHKEYLKYNPKPTTIVISVDAFSFRKTPNLYNHRQFLPYLHKENVQTTMASYKTFSWSDHYIPLLKYYGETEAIKKATSMSLGKSLDNDIRIRGYKPVVKTWTNNFKKAKTKRQKYTVHTDPNIRKLFENFLQECHETNINVIMVYTPLYIEGQNYINNHDEIIAYYQKMATDFKIPFLNYLDLDICTSTEFFYNAMHLNEKGATLFTQKLIQDLKAQNLIEFP